ncbi:hypothetical protein COMNV_01738 [Commensalibacter sp. Nvir]|uniref:CvpA family protein n=1 Tax=Commensalibacter sp. Nvir TaxID=3069817 RepID=UPI002D4321A1|nr:hypothetical protein COMNV_01738 [Commensalibacter sp. Nvir]
MLNSFNWIDLVGLIIILFGALSGLSRGFTREFIGLLGWVISAVLANRWYGNLAPQITSYINSDIIAAVISFISIFILTSLVINTVANAVVGPNSSKFSLLGRLDKLMGACCGAVKGAAGLCILYLLSGIVFSNQQWPQAFQESQLIPYLYQGALCVNNLLPSFMQKEVMVPQSVAPRLTIPTENDFEPNTPSTPPQDNPMGNDGQDSIEPNQSPSNGN